MGLIYVNPQGPNANPDPALSAQDVRETFKRMAMNDEETVALTAGGHTFGKAHGAADQDVYVGSEPEGAGIESQGFGWKNSFKSGLGNHAITSGNEGPWTTNPIKWEMDYLRLLFKYDWECMKVLEELGNGILLTVKNLIWFLKLMVVMKTVLPMMTTADMSMTVDPIYNKICKKFISDPEYFGEAFAKAWFKLLHRDMGPKSNYVAGDYKDVDYIWQDPIKKGKTLTDDEELLVRKKINQSGLDNVHMIETAWASASTFRNSDNRGGANGSRIRLLPQKEWEVNKPKQLSGF